MDKIAFVISVLQREREYARIAPDNVPDYNLAIGFRTFTFIERAALADKVDWTDSYQITEIRYANYNNSSHSPAIIPEEYSRVKWPAIGEWELLKPDMIFGYREFKVGDVIDSGEIVAGIICANS